MIFNSVSSSVFAIELIMASMAGWDVVLVMVFMYILIIFVFVVVVVSMEVMFVEVVLWVCIWMGKLGNLARMVEINIVAARGFNKLVMFFMVSILILCLMSLVVRLI